MQVNNYGKIDAPPNWELVEAALETVGALIEKLADRVDTKEKG